MLNNDELKWLSILINHILKVRTNIELTKLLWINGFIDK